MAGRSRAHLRSTSGLRFNDTDRKPKYARCFVCKHLFCCNNWPDLKPRVERYRSKIVCARCRYNRPVTQEFVDMYLTLQVLGKKECPQGKKQDSKKCGCPVHHARRLVSAHDNFQHTQATKHLGRY